MRRVAPIAAIAMIWAGSGCVQQDKYNSTVMNNRSLKEQLVAAERDRDTQAPDAPGVPDLQDGSDSGISNTDDLTKDNTPTFDAVGAPYFRVYCDEVQVSGDYESDSGTASLQPDGSHQFTAAVKQGKVYGCQFHPEKSGEIGLKIIENFVKQIS